MLPRLPDTRQELTDMARALGADPAKSLYLGKDANERNVETLDLTRYRVVAFATHGLIPGDLDGLTQPALALTAPEVAGVEGDGLLTIGQDFGAQARRRLGGSVGLQHRRGRRRRRRGRLGPRQRVLLCRDARAAGDQLVGPLRVGARTDERSVPPPERRSRPFARRSAAPIDDGADRRPGVGRR